jgi:hypothetical protein
MFDDARGGKDTLIGKTGSYNIFYGDADSMYEHACGGDDKLIGGDGSTNYLHGDAYIISEYAREAMTR